MEPLGGDALDEEAAEAAHLVRLLADEPDANDFVPHQTPSSIAQPLSIRLTPNHLRSISKGQICLSYL